MAFPICPRRFTPEALESNGITHAFGVPDSSLSGLLSFFADTKRAPHHIVVASEGAAIALAAGHHLSTGNVALAYMQNSGLSNATNPLQSLAAKEVFGIPMLLMIGWRGQPGIKDEPQHALIGPRLLENLAANHIPHEMLGKSLSESKEVIARLKARALRDKTPVAVIVPPGSFRNYKAKTQNGIAPNLPSNQSKFQYQLCGEPVLQLSRGDAISSIVEEIQKRDISISSLGGNSRELYMIRKAQNQSLGTNFFCLGAMGHTYPLAFGVSTGFSSGRIFCIDGDGSFLMHVGNTAVLAGFSPDNLVHIVIYNGMHSSTGAQPLMIGRSNLLSLAEGMPYKQKFVVNTSKALKNALRAATSSTLIVVAVNAAVREDLARPSEKAVELKDLFMETFAPSAKL